MSVQTQPRNLKQFVLKPTVYCYHRCPYCDLRQDYYQGMVADRKRALQVIPRNGSTRMPNPGHMPLDMALRTIDEAAALGMEELQLSGGDPLLYPHLVELIRAAKRHPGVFVLMNSVGTGITLEKARDIIDAGLGAWNFSVDTLDPVLYEKLRGVRNALPTIMKAIATVREAGAEFPDFRMNYMIVITRQNFRHIPDVIAHCVDTGVASVYLMNVYGDTTGASLRVIAGSDHPAWPDLVLYLDLPQEAVHDRNHGKFADDNILIDARYNSGFRSYFAELADKRETRVVWLDAMLDPAELLGLAESQIMDLLRIHDA